jgi:hypothetical protein
MGFLLFIISLAVRIEAQPPYRFKDRDLPVEKRIDHPGSSSLDQRLTTSFKVL